MKLKTTCVGIGLSALTILGGCGQKAGRYANMGSQEVTYFVKNTAGQIVDTITLSAKKEAEAGMNAFNMQKIKIGVDECIKKGDTILTYFKKPMEILYDKNAASAGAETLTRMSAVGDASINKSTYYEIYPVFRDTKLPQDAVIVNKAKGDSIDYIIK